VRGRFSAGNRCGGLNLPAGQPIVNPFLLSHAGASRPHWSCRIWP
jgi:hypothetical protein